MPNVISVFVSSLVKITLKQRMGCKSVGMHDVRCVYVVVFWHTHTATTDIYTIYRYFTDIFTDIYIHAKDYFADINYYILHIQIATFTTLEFTEV